MAEQNPQETPKPSGLPDGAPSAVVRAAEPGGNIDELTGGEEKSALDWLLGATQALEYNVPVEYDTPAGRKKLLFHIRQQDPGALETLDAEHRKGDGPFARLDTAAFNAALIAKATVYIKDGETGVQVEPNSERFRGGVPDPALAVATRFKYQGGILEGIAEEIRRVSGYSPDRVGTAQRAVVEVGKS